MTQTLSPAPAHTGVPKPAIAEIITRPEELRAVMGEPSSRAVQKDVGRLDSYCRAFIARSPFALVGSADADGHTDVSPRGDAPGFALVLDEQTLVLPERPGNRRGDTLTNVLATGQAGLIFLIPGVEETLRVNGRALAGAGDPGTGSVLPLRQGVPALPAMGPGRAGTA
jgi:predicted pyridoxine 5'-phosphate oxidase superfamily flavin-nucleotide-binding protein